MVSPTEVLKSRWVAAKVAPPAFCLSSPKPSTTNQYAILKSSQTMNDVVHKALVRLKQVWGAVQPYEAVYVICEGMGRVAKDSRPPLGGDWLQDR